MELLDWPEIGTVLHIDEQAFEVIGIAPHINKGGGKVQLIEWQSACPDCAAELRVRSTMKVGGWSRRCGDCAKPGKPIKGKRGRQRKLVLVPA